MTKESTVVALLKENFSNVTRKCEREGRKWVLQVKA